MDDPTFTDHDDLLDAVITYVDRKITDVNNQEPRWQLRSRWKTAFGEWSKR